MNVPTETITLTMGDDNYNYNSRCLLGSLAVNKKNKKKTTECPEQNWEFCQVKLKTTLRSGPLDLDTKGKWFECMNTVTQQDMVEN